MAEVDTSSYPKAAQPVQQSPFDIASKINTLQQQQLAIGQAKLDQANQGLTYLTRAMTSLGPNATKEQYKAVGQNAVDMGLAPANMLQLWNGQVDAAPDSQTFYRHALAATMDHQQQIQTLIGQSADKSDSANVYSGVQASPVMGGGFTPATKLPVQLPPTTPNVNNQPTLPNGQPNPNYLQPGYVGASGPAGVVSARPAGLPASPQNNAPAVAAPKARPSLSALTTGPTGPTVQTGFNFNDRFSAAYPNSAGPVASGAPPGVAEAIQHVGAQSGQDYAADLTRAKNYQSDLYPMERVLDIIHQEGEKAFGPGTDQLTNLKSALVTWLPNADQKMIDNVSNLQQAKKYLVQAARSAGNTGTNDQLAAAFEANPNTTMSGATIATVVKSNIALRKMQMAQTLLFGQQNLPPSQYSQWIAKNQNVLDPRAFGFDMMDNAARSKLVSGFATKDSSGNLIAKKGKEKEFNRFEQSLSFANDAELIAPPGKS